MRRQEWLNKLILIVDPVLQALSEDQLYEKLPVDFHPTRKSYSMLEAFGRSFCGLAPQLEVELENEEEQKLQKNIKSQ